MSEMRPSTPLVSYIVPVYNAECYIERCVESLLNQSYSNIEFIFIDDASTDASLSVLRDVVSRHRRKDAVRVLINPHNCGSAATRAEGIDVATGEYIMFCDSDDYVEPNMVSVMMAVAMDKECDMVMSGYYDNFPDRETTVQARAGREPDLNDVPIDTLHFALWNKLIKTELVRRNNLHDFTQVDCWDDVAITARVFALVEKVVVIDAPLYHYCHVAGGASLTSQRHEVRMKDHLACAEYLDGWFASHGLAERYAQFLKFMKFTSKIKMLRGGNFDVKRWRHTFPETNRGILHYRHIPLLYRIGFWAISL